MDMCSHKHDFGIGTEWMFFATSYCKSPCDAVGGAGKMICSQVKPPNIIVYKCLQMSLNNQILDYRVMLDLCENEMMSIKFFWNL